MTTTAPAWNPDAEFDRRPPHDIAAEQHTLGAMLLSKDAIGEVMEVITPRDHYRPAHQLIHEVILALYGRNQPADAVTVAAELTTRGDIGRMGGHPYLFELVHGVATAANAVFYARIVRNRAILRRMIESGTRVVQMGYSGDAEPEELLAKALDEMDTIAADAYINELAEIGDGFADVLTQMERPGVPPKMVTGFTDIDRHLDGGLEGGRLIVVAARPALGKSTLALDFARNISIRQGLRVAFWSLEMPRDEILTKVICAEARVDLTSAKRHELSDIEWTRISKHAASIAAAPLLLNVTEKADPVSIRAALLQLIRKGTPADMLIIDYLQLLSLARRVENRQQEVAQITRSLKQLAMELDIPVLVCAQLNRGPEARADHKPMLADLRESGEVEQSADIVFLLHRPEVSDPTERIGEADLMCVKFRGGQPFTVTLSALLHVSQFADMAWTPTTIITNEKDE